jgi:hypothetical protein
MGLSFPLYFLLLNEGKGWGKVGLGDEVKGEID